MTAEAIDACAQSVDQREPEPDDAALVDVEGGESTQRLARVAVGLQMKREVAPEGGNGSENAGLPG